MNFSFQLKGEAFRKMYPHELPEYPGKIIPQNPNIDFWKMFPENRPGHTRKGFANKGKTFPYVP